MADNLTLIKREFDIHKGQFVITASHTIERLIGVGTDDFDYYWLCYDGREIHWYSCVGRYMVLKNQLKDDDYQELVRLAKLNDIDYLMEDELFIEYLDNYTKTLPPNHSILAGLYFDLS